MYCDIGLFQAVHGVYTVAMVYSRQWCYSMYCDNGLFQAVVYVL